MDHRKLKYLPMFVIILVTVLMSCEKTQEQVENEHLNTFINQSKISTNYSWIVILPGLGCHGCIQEGEAFMRDHIKNADILFVLTKISSIKILQQKTGIQLAKQPNVYIDRENNFNIPTDNGIYPCIIKMVNGRIVSHDFQSPKNGGAFAKLTSLVLAQ